MGKVINGIVIDDDLFQEYHKFQKGEGFDQKKIRQLNLKYNVVVFH